MVRILIGAALGGIAGGAVDHLAKDAAPAITVGSLVALTIWFQAWHAIGRRAS